MKRSKFILLSFTCLALSFCLNLSANIKTSHNDEYSINNRFLSTKKPLKADEIEINKISSLEDLLAFVQSSSSESYSKNKNFELTCDIDLNGKLISPVPIFSGTFNGNNHTIKNYVIDTKSSGNECGFFRVLSKNSSINNLILDGSIETKNQDTSIGAIVGTNYGSIKNCKANGIIKGINIVGGIVGNNAEEGLISDCINYAQVIGKIFTGGITGHNQGTITGSKNHGKINDVRFSSTDELSLSNIGGISGFNTFKIIDCYNYGSVGRKQVGKLVGGISGSSIGQVKYCSNYGLVKGDTYVGGIVGYYAEFTNKKEEPNLDNLFDIINKILNNNKDNKEIVKKEPGIGLVTSTLKYCLNTAEITGESSVGGVVGYVSNATTAIGQKRVFDVNNCVNEGYVIGIKQYVGGIVGNHLNGSISECFNAGNIQGKTAQYVGGITGSSGGEISYSFAINDMSGKKYVGGIGGYNNKLHDCYSIVKIEKGSSFIGSLSGSIKEANEDIYNNFYVNDDFYGFDNIDYETKSTKLKKDELASKGSLNISLDPTYYEVDSSKISFPYLKSFLSLEETNETSKSLKDITINTYKFGSYVNFINSEGEIIKKVFVYYNENLDLNEIPDVPLKNGHFGKWEDFVSTNIINNLYIRAIYEEIITSIASNTDKKPTMLAEGNFYNSTKLVVLKSNKNILDDKSIYTYLDTYETKLVDENNSVDTSLITYKLLLEKKYEKPRIAIKENDKLKILDSKIDGEYLVFTKDGSSNTFYLLDEKFANWNNPYFIATVVCSIVGGLLVIGGITTGVIFYVKKKKKKQKPINK